jgi:type I restriction enzyme M protein
LVEADILGYMIEKLLESSIDLSQNPLLNPDGPERLPALDNHAMGILLLPQKTAHLPYLN